jgi:hypothetical protein
MAAEITELRECKAELLAALRRAENALRIDAQDHANAGAWESGETQFVLQAANAAWRAIARAEAGG